MQNTNLVIFLQLHSCWDFFFFFRLNLFQTSVLYDLKCSESFDRVLSEREAWLWKTHFKSNHTCPPLKLWVFLGNDICSISIWKHSQRLCHLALVIYPLTSPEVLPVRCLFMRWQQTHKGKLSAGLPEQQKLQATSLSHPSLPSQPHTITYNCKRPGKNVFLPSRLTMICGKTSVLQLTSAPAS